MLEEKTDGRGRYKPYDIVLDYLLSSKQAATIEEVKLYNDRDGCRNNSIYCC